MSKQSEKIIETARNDEGYMEGANNWNKFAEMIDKDYPEFYNYPKQNVEWCDVWYDSLFLRVFGFDKALKMLCQPKKSAGAGCKYSAQYYKKKNRWFSDAKEGDQIFFGDAGNESHTGLVVKVDDKKVYTIEGNSDNMVKEHSYSLNSKKITGYGRPIWDDETMADTAPTKPEPSQKPQNAAKLSEEEIAVQVINGKWGNGKEREKKLTEAGYDYAKIQAIVNQKLQKPSQKPKEENKDLIGIVATNKSKLNIRSGAGLNYGIIGTLAKGSKVKLSKKEGSWYKLADQRGYVSASFIKIV